MPQSIWPSFALGHAPLIRLGSREAMPEVLIGLYHYGIVRKVTCNSWPVVVKLMVIERHVRRHACEQPPHVLRLKRFPILPSEALAQFLKIEGIYRGVGIDLVADQQDMIHPVISFDLFPHRLEDAVGDISIKGRARIAT